MLTAEQLRKRLESIKADNEQRLTRIRARIDETEQRGGSIQDLKRQLSERRNAAEKSEELVEKQIKAAEERELVQAQEIEKNRKAVAAQLEARQKFRAERTWIAAGGDPKAFEVAWPALKEKLLEQAVIEKSAQPEGHQTFVRSL